MKNSQGKPAIAQDFGVTPGKEPARHRRMIAIDPGDVHVGVAEFVSVNDQPWLCVLATENTPAELLALLAHGLRRGLYEEVVVESWRLFPSSAPMYVGSDMPTSRLIGGIHALVSYIPDSEAWFSDEVELHFQDPQIKVPTRGWLKRRKMRSVARIHGVTADHAMDAELHGYKRLIDTNRPIANSLAQSEYWDLRPRKRDLSSSHVFW